jgi:hypothetical protein
MTATCSIGSSCVRLIAPRWRVLRCQHQRHRQQPGESDDGQRGETAIWMTDELEMRLKTIRIQLAGIATETPNRVPMPIRSSNSTIGETPKREEDRAKLVTRVS